MLMYTLNCLGLVQQVERDNLEAQLASTKESLQTQLSQLVEGKHLQELQYDVDKASLEEELLTSRKESRDATLKLLAAVWLLSSSVSVHSSQR